MRPPWLGHSREEAELEALQTDIMRFMAILGFCLAAIFSLVQGAGQEQVAMQQAAVAPIAVAQPPAEQVQAASPAPERAEARPLLIKHAARPVPAVEQIDAQVDKTEPLVGFTLEFTSAAALETLVQQGQVQLLARHGDQFWSVDARGLAARIDAPSAYHQMHADTVPHRLRSALAEAQSGVDVSWGVTLPDDAAGQIRRLTAGRTGGNLLIGADGVVVLNNSFPNGEAPNTAN